jgi:signal transduction histidine kinase/DNA-binding response OmpR family regulator
MIRHISILLFTSCMLFPLVAQESADSLLMLLDHTDEDTTRLRLLCELTDQLRMSDPDTAIYYAIESYELADRLQDKSGKARSLYFSGVIYRKLGLLSSAIDNLNASLDLYEALQDSLGLATVYNAFGNLWLNEDNDQAQEYFKKSLALFQAMGNDTYIPHIYLNLGSTYDGKKEYAQAQQYYFLALEIMQEAGDSSRTMIAALLNIGENYEYASDLENAFKYYIAGLNLSKDLGNNPRLVDSYIHLGRYYNIIDDFDMSIAYLDSAMTIAREQSFLAEIRDNAELLADSYKKKGDYKSALYYAELYSVISDSIKRMEANALLRSYALEREYNREIQQKESDLQRVKLLRNFAVIALLLVVISLFYMYRNYRMKNKANALLAEVDELKTRMFSNISHELRTPLTLILDPIQQMLDDEQMQRPSARTLKLMERNVNKLLALINQLLDLSKLDSGKLKIELVQGDVIRHLRIIALSFTSLADKKNIHYSVKFPDEELISYFDADKLDKVLTNLVGNAIKYTDEGGSISVNVMVDKDDSHKRKSDERGESIQIEVRDTGRGIPEEELSRIFDRFYQVRGKDEPESVGTGIGLSLTKELVDLMHGDIMVESKVNLGTRFYLSIPLGTSHLGASDYIIVEEPEASEKSYQERLESDSRKEQPSHVGDDRQIILTVEDNEDIRIHIINNLAEYNVMEAADGAAGLQIATEQLPDLVITDLMMPKMDGVELCNKLKTDERTSHIPVIMLTAKTSVEDRIEGLETGADDYLTKPFNVKELRVRVKNLIRQRQKLRERFRKELMLEPREIAVTSVDERFINQSLEIIEKNMSEQDFSVEQLGSELAMSRMQLFRKIKALTDQSPSEYIRTIRLKRAAHLIKSNFGNLAQITYEVGFNHPSYFAKCFRELYGVAPSEYGKS